MEKKNIKLYHGSLVIVEKPDINHSKSKHDFGNGFYLTSVKEQAFRWTKRSIRNKNKKIGYLNIYDFNVELARRDLLIKIFEKPSLEWLDFVINNRGKKAFDFNYDLVIGPVANDNAYETIKLYELGRYPLELTLEKLKVEKLRDQYLFHTEKSIKYFNFFEALEIK
ncbi:MAG: DUF3990 domain-containing protein [Bacillales bacterium]|jgi:hypothetical protein|nr:DUF3990 domain-containing protein [Bacillales bacterium]